MDNDTTARILLKEVAKPLQTVVPLYELQALLIAGGELKWAIDERENTPVNLPTAARELVDRIYGLVGVLWRVSPATPAQLRGLADRVEARPEHDARLNPVTGPIFLNMMEATARSAQRETAREETWWAAWRREHGE